MVMLILVWLTCGVAASIVASNRGGSGCLWFGLGIVFGPFGLLMAFANGTRCPRCAKGISTDAKVCPHCQVIVVDTPGTGTATQSPATAPEPTKQCAFCAEKILAAAIKCRFCGEMLDKGSV
jgi:hypothetical protein